MSVSLESIQDLRAATVELGAAEDWQVPTWNHDDCENAVIQYQAKKLNELRGMENDFPLATSTLWLKDDAVCDQQRQVAIQLVTALTVLLGGNRSGKTFGAFMADVAVALGRDHPMVAAWMLLNGIPEDSIPLGPGEVIVIAPSSGSSRRDHRRQIDALLPRHGKRWHGMNGLAECYVEIDCPGYEKKARIWFKSMDQGHKAFKGSEARRYHIDEEPEGDEARLVLEECLRGASSVGGHTCITMTPQAGNTWVQEDLVTAQKYGCVTLKINSIHNVLVADYEALVRWLDSLPPDERRMRQLGEFIDRKGVIYTRFSRGDLSRGGPGCLCEPFEIPPDWLRFRGADYGIKNPTAVVWGAIGDDGTLYVYLEHSEAGPSYDEHAETVQELSGAEKDSEGVWRGGEPYEGSWGDPAAKEARSTWAKADLYFSKAVNDVKEGISKLHARMRILDDGRPRIKIFSTCKKLIKEIENYRWDPKRKDPAPLKINDHLCDALRYLVMGIARYYGE